MASRPRSEPDPLAKRIHPNPGAAGLPSREQILAHHLTKRDVRVIANAAPSAGIPADEALARLPRRGTDLVYMGSFLPYKNVETLLRAMAHLPGRTLHLLSRISPARRAELQAQVPAGARVVAFQSINVIDLQNDRGTLVPCRGQSYPDTELSKVKRTHDVNYLTEGR